MSWKINVLTKFNNELMKSTNKLYKLLSEQENVTYSN